MSESHSWRAERKEPTFSRETPLEAANDNEFGVVHSQGEKTPAKISEKGAVLVTSSERHNDATNAEGRIKLRAAVVELEHLAEQAARDKAERTLTEEKGKSGFFKRIWKHGMAREFYRQRELIKARKEIHEKGSIYAAEDPVVEQKVNDEAMKAVMDRFTSEYGDQVLRSGESKHQLGDKEKKDLRNENSESQQASQALKALVEGYAMGKYTDADFNEAKKRIMANIRRSEGSKEDALYADNFLEIARQAKKAVEHGIGLEKLDIDCNITVGKARDALKTEAKYNWTDRQIDKLNNSKVGKIFNESTIATGVAVASIVGTFFTRKLLSSKAAAIASFGGAAVLGGAITGVLAGKRFEEDREAQARAKAQGRVPDKENSPRRSEMDQFMYDVKSSRELATNLRETLANVEKGGKQMTPEQINTLIQNVAEAEARIKLMDVHNIDLLSYSDVTKIEQERLDLDIARAEAKVALKKIPGTDQTIAAASNLIMDGLLGEKGGKNGGIREKDRLFNKMKTKKVLTAIGVGTLIGGAAGIAGQEIGALFTSEQTGLLEHAFKGMDVQGTGTAHRTALEGLWSYIVNPVHGGPGMHPVDLGGRFVNMPNGLDIVANHNGSYDLMQDGKPAIHGLTFDKGGHFSQDSLKMLHEHGLGAHSEGVTNVEKWLPEKVSDQQFVENHKLGHVSRDWYDNDTAKPVFDENEQQLHWGGDHGSGTDAQDNYHFTIASMLPGGSHHGSLSADAMKLAHDGHLKLLISVSEGTQAHPIEVSIDEHGNALIAHDSPAAKLFTTDANGHAVFNGRFAEVAEVTGNSNGTEHVHILATAEGKGMTQIEDMVKSCKPVLTDTITAPTDYSTDWPLIAPILSRRPLEPVTRRTTPLTPVSEVPRSSEPPVTTAPEEGNKSEDTPPDAGVPVVVPAGIEVGTTKDKEIKQRPPSGINLRAPRIEVKESRRDVRAKTPDIRPSAARRSAPAPRNESASPRMQNRRAPERPGVGEVAYRNYPEQNLTPRNKADTIFDDFFASTPSTPKKVGQIRPIPRRPGDKKPRIRGRVESPVLTADTSIRRSTPTSGTEAAIESVGSVRSAEPVETVSPTVTQSAEGTPSVVDQNLAQKVEQAPATPQETPVEVPESPSPITEQPSAAEKPATEESSKKLEAASERSARYEQSISASARPLGIDSDDFVRRFRGAVANGIDPERAFAGTFTSYMQAKKNYDPSKIEQYTRFISDVLGSGYRISVPKVSGKYDMNRHMDASVSATGSRSKVMAVIAPGIESSDGKVLAKSVVDTTGS
jgi:hypothetical protein